MRFCDIRPNGKGEGLTTRIAGLVFALCLTSTAAHADLFQWEDAKWRLEITGWQGINGGSFDRQSDQGLTLSVEREVPISNRWSVGMKAFPLFLYEDKVNDTIVGVGGGLQLRYYLTRDSRRGFYLEGGISGLFHPEKFSGNSSHANFMEEAGIGYEFERGFTVSLKIAHISNASVADQNSGVNMVGLSLGYTF